MWRVRAVRVLVESPGVSNVAGSSGAVVESPRVLQVVNVKSGPLGCASARVCWRLGGSSENFNHMLCS